MLRTTVNVVFSLLLTASWATGAGFNIFEHGARATGSGMAIAARADDISSLFYNPAAMSSLDGTQFSLGVTLIAPSGTFTGENTLSDTSGELASQLFYPPNLYISSKVHDRIHVGIGIFSPFGLGTKWKNPDSFMGRALSQEGSIRSVYMNPVVSFLATPDLSIAGGLQVVISDVELKRAVVDPASGVNLAKVKLSGDSSPAIGWNAGLRYGHDALPLHASFGASYRSSVEVSYDGDLELTEAIPAIFGATSLSMTASADITFASLAQVGVAVDVTPKLVVEVDVVRMGWSVFDSLKVVAQDPNFNSTLPENYDDVLSYRLGAEYAVSDVLTMRCGYLYDTAPGPKETLSPLLPDANRNGFALGLGWKVCPSGTVDVAYLYMAFADRSTDGANLLGFNGTYKNHAHLIGLNFNYKL